MSNGTIYAAFRRGTTDMSEKRMPLGLNILSWVLRATAAVILLQTLFFKFTAAPESVYIFTKVGAEPWGRIGSGVVEFIAAVLILTPRFTWLGSVLALGVMAGAILSHLTILGIEVQGDKGLLFALAVIVFVASAVNLVLHRNAIPVIGRRLA
jgi:putative oxidoreductase